MPFIALYYTQESLLFSGTLRDNLDPYQSFNDDVLWGILEQVQLKSYITGTV